jgi:rhodanese-related sulfurtransferase
VRWRRIAIILIAAAVLGSAWDAFSGRGFDLRGNVYIKPGDQLVNVTEAKRRFDIGAALFLDARPSMSYEFGHIPGALLLPEDDFEPAFKKLERKLRGRLDIIVYCSGFGCESSHIVARLLKERGIPAAVLQDGIPAWEGAGYPLRQGARP